ncbi:putative Mannosidase Ig/CBM-like domain-containing protein [Seiridium cardinale]
MTGTAGTDNHSASQHLLKRVELKEGWFLQQLDNDERLSVPSVPTDVYRILAAHHKIANPVEDLNELSVSWVADKDWKYTAKLRIDAQAVRNGTSLDLVFEGLDTFATVRLDGDIILESDNMFLSHRCSITNLLNKAESHEYELEIVFASARLRGQELIEQHKHEHRFIARQTEDSRIPVRKAQYHWGWDWGPVLVGTSGPWRPVYLEYYSARVDDLWAENSLDDEKCTCQLYCKTAGTSEVDAVLFSVSFEGEKLFSQTCSIEKEGLAQCSFQIISPQLWYPFTHGAQSRYKISAVLTRGGKDILDQVSKNIGLRKVELVKEPDQYGKPFYFRINGIDIFAGGSCWIPASNHLSALTGKDYYEWVKLLREGNQNMVRIWGGGIYEDDSFYEACDELGILVWQDFCFACGNYPAYPSFRSSVEAEARQNVRLLRSHPSIVIWAGSNEDYQVQERYKLKYDYQDKDPESWLKTDFPARYYYEYLLPKVVEEEHKDAAYHPTSPWGDGERTDNPTVGDLHQWNIWHGTMEKYQYSDKLCGRFVSEFGMIAYPHLETIKSAITQPAEQYPGSVTMDFHNKAIGHERRLMSYVAENFQVKYDLASFIHLSQIVQAEAMSYAYKSWRKFWGTKEQRQCGGVLVWQLNDCWPTTSWAVVDHYRVKKPAFYSIKRALEPCTIATSRTCRNWSQKRMNDMLDLGQVDPTLEAREGTEFEVWVVNSLQSPMTVDIKVRFISIKTGEDVLPAVTKQLVAQADATTTTLKSAIKPLNADLLDRAKPFDLAKYDPYVIHATMAVGNEVISRDPAWPQPFKYLDFSERGIKFNISEVEYGVSLIRITAERPVKGLVFEETRAMSINANNLDIIPGDEDVVVKIKGVPSRDLRYTYIGAPSGSIEL